MIKNADLPAMPHTTWDNEVNQVICQGSGLTKREYFAGLAMQGVLSNQDIIDNMNTETREWAAKRSVSIADALLAELERTK